MVSPLISCLIFIIVPIEEIVRSGVVPSVQTMLSDSSDKFVDWEQQYWEHKESKKHKVWQSLHWQAPFATMIGKIASLADSENHLKIKLKEMMQQWSKNIKLRGPWINRDITALPYSPRTWHSEFLNKFQILQASLHTYLSCIVAECVQKSLTLWGDHLYNILQILCNFERVVDCCLLAVHWTLFCIELLYLAFEMAL